jgi:SRSO17 transposase
MQACFSRVCSEMSNAKPVGCGRRQLAILARSRLYDWCYLELADLEVDEFYGVNPGLWTRGLLIRRRIADGDLAFFTTWCPTATSIETLVAVEGHRWAIEDSFETAKNEFGLDHNESRSWHGWHRHVSLVMLAFAMMAVRKYKRFHHRLGRARLFLEKIARENRRLFVHWQLGDGGKLA